MDDINKYIEERLGEGWSFDEVRLFGQPDESAAETALQKMVDDYFWDEKWDGGELTLKAWFEHVELFEKTKPGVLSFPPVDIGVRQHPGLSASLRPGSAWMALKDKFLKKMKPGSVANIERSARDVLSHLSLNTDDEPSVKGLVYGSVQSGKTSNMEALMSMAADEGWNLFVVLSGTIDSLRTQTMERMLRDLENTKGVRWIPIDLNSRQAPPLSSLRLEASNEIGTSKRERYLTVCLKQKSRLKRLIDWMYENPDRTRRLRVVIIDDEADQASINTATILPRSEQKEYIQQRKEINRLIVNLANGLTSDGGKAPASPGALNYISYTATPYANVLNEGPGESLYPRHFVHGLTDPDEYFGANALFGVPGALDDEGEEVWPGLDVIREIPDEEVLSLKKYHQKKGGKPALDNLRRAIAWFACSAAVLRVRGHREPVSMLVHTSQKVAHHEIDRRLVEEILHDGGRLLALCESVYETEAGRFGLDDLRRGFPRYGRLDEVSADLPAFSEIAGEVETIVSEVSFIQIDDEGEPTFTKGVNLCVDNCASKGYSEDDAHPRLIYPKDPSQYPEGKAPVFIVLGGNTLSRGLTIEGLSCTYFTREVSCADTLMQMARWFGYRKGYELLQRVWLTPSAWGKYRSLSKADYALKGEMRRFVEMGISPETLGVKVGAMPEIPRFRTTDKKKMQSAEVCGYDFAGYACEVTEYYPERHKLEGNLKGTLSFLEGLGGGEKSYQSSSTWVWRDIDCDVCTEYLKSLDLPEATSASTLGSLVGWLSEKVDGQMRFPLWNVAVPGPKRGEGDVWEIGYVELGRVHRTKLRDRNAVIDVGSLRSGPDALADVDYPNLPSSMKLLFEQVKKERKGYVAARSKLGLDQRPLLIVYRIAGEAEPPATKDRIPIGAPVDPIGVVVVVPGDREAKGAAAAYSIKLN